MHRTELSPRPARLRAPGCALLLGLALLFTLAGCSGSDAESGSLDGIWSGAIIDQYLCEAGETMISATIGGTTFTVDSTTGYIDLTGATAALTTQEGGVYRLALDSPALTGLLAVDPQSQYAALLLQHPDSTAPPAGVFGLLTKGAGGTPSHADSDIDGTWSGYTAALNGDFTLAASAASSATIGPGTFEHTISGTDGEGVFDGTVSPLNLTMLWRGFLGQGEFTYEPGFFLSPDNNGAVGVFLPDDCALSSGYIFPTDVKFSVWSRQP
jgi:hypothetical protein